MSRPPRLAAADALRLAHLAALAGLALWMGLTQPAGLLPALVLALIAACGEILPRGSWRELGSPVLVVFAGLASWAVGDGGRGAMHATLGTLVAALILVPARPGALRLVAPVCALELVVAGLPEVAVVGPWTAICALLPLALAALAVDAWLGARLDAKPGATARLAALRWAVLPAAAAAILGATAFVPAERIADGLRGPTNGRGKGPGGTVAPTKVPGAAPRDAVAINPGDQPPRDPSPAARLFLPGRPPGVTYLRLAACSLLQRDEITDRWRWLPAPGEIELEPRKPPADLLLAQLVRMPGWGDTVLMPDEGQWAGLDGLYADGEGNRWRPGLSEAIRSYPVSMGPQERREAPGDIAATAAACREVPPGMADWPWARIEDPAWRRLPPEIAAERIGEALRSRCSYDLDVPKPPEGSDPLSTFLFSDDPRMRRGICEHFAGAAALLLRRAGHPARCVAGFASSEWDGSSLIFRRLHAHAWIEVLDEDGRWVRPADPTPPVAMALRGGDLDPALAPPPDPAKAVALKPLPLRRLPLWAWLAIAALAVAAVAWAVRHRHHDRVRRRHADRQAVHRRRGEELVRLAQELGLRVAASDTAATLCGRITARTGRDLSRELAAYEASRFGDGPAAGPWPADELKAMPRPA